MPSLNWEKIEAWFGIPFTTSFLRSFTWFISIGLLHFGFWYLLWLLLPVVLKWAVGGVALLCLIRVCLDRWGGQDVSYPVLLIGRSALLGLSVFPIGWVIAEAMMSEEMVSVFQAVKTVMLSVFQAIKTWW